MAESIKKLKPIYDALDARNNKQAHKLCTQALQKQPNVVILKVLKALAAERLGKRDEALELMREAQEAKPTDEQTLNTMMHVFKALGKLEDALACYEQAWTKNPNDPDIAAQVFFSYVKLGHVAKQQQMAMKMYKQFGKVEHLLWGVASTALQGREAGGAKLLQLAEGMLSKLDKDGKLPNYEALLLYAEVLEQQGKKREALELWAGKTGEALCPVPFERKRARADLHAALGEAREANAIFADLICTHDADEWSYYVAYIETLLKYAPDTGARPGAAGACPGPGEAHGTLAEALAFLARLQGEHGPGAGAAAPKRAPFLAELELEAQLVARGAPAGDASLARLSEMVVRYFERWGGRPVCVLDLAPYLRRVAEAGAGKGAALAARVAGTLGEKPGEGKGALEWTARAVNARCVERALGAHRGEGVAQALAAAQGLLGEYEASLSLPLNLEPTERRPGDDLLLLASHRLLDAHAATGDAQWLVEAATLLELGLRHSRHNFQFKLLLLRLYSRLGAGVMAARAADALDLKHIQLETLLHAGLGEAVRGLAYGEALGMAEELLAFHRDAQRDCPDFVANAFRHGSYTKVAEFLAFRERLRRSALAHTAAAEWVQLMLFLHHFQVAEAREMLASTEALNIDHADPRPRRRPRLPRPAPGPRPGLLRLLRAPDHPAASGPPAREARAARDGEIGARRLWAKVNALPPAALADALASSLQELGVLKLHAATEGGLPGTPACGEGADWFDGTSWACSVLIARLAAAVSELAGAHAAASLEAAEAASRAVAHHAPLVALALQHLSSHLAMAFFVGGPSPPGAPRGRLNPSVLPYLHAFVYRNLHWLAMLAQAWAAAPVFAAPAGAKKGKKKEAPAAALAEAVRGAREAVRGAVEELLASHSDLNGLLEPELGEELASAPKSGHAMHFTPNLPSQAPPAEHEGGCCGVGTTPAHAEALRRRGLPYEAAKAAPVPFLASPEAAAVRAEVLAGVSGAHRRALFTALEFLRQRRQIVAAAAVAFQSPAPAS
eukprot:tig00000448_g864.t1